jgi:hypothetical protein
METKTEQAINKLAMAITAQTQALTLIGRRLPEPESHHREPTVDPRYETLRTEFETLADRMLNSTPTVYSALAVRQQILAVLAKVAP